MRRVRWSYAAERAGCPRCGSVPFRRGDAADTMSVSPGRLDAPTGLTPGRRISAAPEGDRHDIEGDPPRRP